MQVISASKIDIGAYGKTSAGDVYRVHVKVKNIKNRADDIINSISNSCWISKLGLVEQASYSARAKKTVIRLVDNILSKVDDVVTDEFGEYLVSQTAKDTLSYNYEHLSVPLAELWKEKIAGNPGFDFHSESKSNMIAFGEAKYSSKINPHTIAVKQIVFFVENKKDIMELVDLQHFVSKQAIDNAMQNKKAFVAAFSINGKNYNQIFDTVIKSNIIDPLLNYPELYLIGVEL